MELATTDPAAARALYGTLLGWQVLDVPKGPNGVYTIYQLEGRDAAAGYKLRADQQGVPPHWMLYVSVENVDTEAPEGRVARRTVGDVAVRRWRFRPHGGGRRSNRRDVFAMAR